MGGGRPGGRSVKGPRSWSSSARSAPAGRTAAGAAVRRVACRWVSFRSECEETARRGMSAFAVTGRGCGVLPPRDSGKRKERRFAIWPLSGGAQGGAGPRRGISPALLRGTRLCPAWGATRRTGGKPKDGCVWRPKARGASCRTSVGQDVPRPEGRGVVALGEAVRDGAGWGHPGSPWFGNFGRNSYLVDPASSHMLVSKIKPCMCKYKLFCTVKLRMAH